MSAALDRQHLHQRPPSDSLPETKLLKYFASLPSAQLIEREPSLLGEKYHLFQASLGDFVGTGRGPTRFVGCLKAIAECLERKFMKAAFAGHLSHVPKWQQTSNGFAVHTGMARARKAAKLEAMERHILQMAYFKDGWSGFQALDSHEDKNLGLMLTRIVSRYRCDGLRAGMVVATGKKFAGISAGYICAEEFGFESSPKWRHAHFEAVDKIEPMLEQHQIHSKQYASPLERDLYHWLLGPIEDLNYGTQLAVVDLAPSEIVVHDFELAASWGLDFPFFGAFAAGKRALPLVVSSRIEEVDCPEISALLEIHGLSPKMPLRNPIL